jgi:osmoprotectant transport system ATP-binding protein
MPENDSVISFKDASYAVGGNRILESLELDIILGETLILLGESGCGKTTTLKLINRLIDPTAGSVLVDGKPTTEWDVIKLRRHIGYVLQEAGLFPHFTVAENVALVLTLENWDKERKRGRVVEMLDLVGLDAAKFADRFPHELSGGQRQRVGVARALAADPPIVLLDEPFGALDAITRTNLQKEFAGLVRDLGKTAVFVTHDLHEAMTLGTRIALMDKGRIVLLDTPTNFASSDLPLARAYLETVS